jgi:hypothetical protein
MTDYLRIARLEIIAKRPKVEAEEPLATSAASLTTS